MYANRHLTNAQLFCSNKVVNDVRRCNEINGIGEVTTQRTVANLGYLANALAGEAGELSNVVKKIWRDGETSKRMEDLGEECCDVIIYLIMLLDVCGINIDRAWERKYGMLEDRFEVTDPRTWQIDNPTRPLVHEDS